MLDLSSDFGLIRMGLYQALEEIELDSESRIIDEQTIRESFALDSPVQVSERTIDLSISFQSRLSFICFYRQSWPQDYFGTSDDEEVAAILRVYGRYVASKKSCNLFF